jgi:hypothetical protein
MQTLINIETKFAIHKSHLKNEDAKFFNKLALKKKKKDSVDATAGRMSDSEYK